MFGPIRSLLFSTNLSENCRPALEASIALATQHQAEMILLHIIDREVPGQVEEHFKIVLGDKKWEALKAEHEKEAHQALIGKMSSDKLTRKVMAQYCQEAGLDTTSCTFPWKDVVVPGSDVAGIIIEQAALSNADLIVLGSRKGFLGGNAVGSTIKSVLRKSVTPVLVVPARSGKK
jgi:nucleotide-binding universal stress UspA family protein